MSGNIRVLLVLRPDGAPVADDFRIETAEVPEPADGQVLLRTLWLSLDPYMRGMMNPERSYANPMTIGQVMVGSTVSRVEQSRHPDFAVGDIVRAYTGWQSWAVADSSGLRRVDTTFAPASAALGILGTTGFTAWAGLLEIGRPQPGETVVVSAAAGAVGSAAGQIARIKGARAVGIAGGADKCAYLMTELGFDAAVDYRAADFEQQLRTACPDGVDVYFENVGGKVWDTVFALLNRNARVPLCGLIAGYNAPTDTDIGLGGTSAQALLRQMLFRSISIRGFLLQEFFPLEAAFQRDIAAWLESGRLHYREDIVEGLENAPAAFIGLLEGRNFGKLLIKVGAE